MQVLKSLLVVLLLSFLSMAQAGLAGDGESGIDWTRRDLIAFRAFWLDRNKHGVHGPSHADPEKPYEATIVAPSEKAARQKLLHEDPHAVHIEINNLGKLE